MLSGAFLFCFHFTFLSLTLRGFWEIICLDFFRVRGFPQTPEALWVFSGRYSCHSPKSCFLSPLQCRGWPQLTAANVPPPFSTSPPLNVDWWTAAEGIPVSDIGLKSWQLPFKFSWSVLTTIWGSPPGLLNNELVNERETRCSNHQLTSTVIQGKEAIILAISTFTKFLVECSCLSDSGWHRKSRRMTVSVPANL